MTDIQLHLKEILAELPPQTRLVAVSKFHPAEAIREAYDMGQRIFGESKVQELTGSTNHCRKISNGISSGICRPTR